MQDDDIEDVPGPGDPDENDDDGTDVGGVEKKTEPGPVNAALLPLRRTPTHCGASKCKKSSA